MNKKRILGFLAFAVVCGVIYLFLMRRNENEFVDIVKNGSPNEYPKITYGQAFANYFGDGKWEYFRSEDDCDVVEFTGKCNYQGKNTDIVVQFVVTNKKREEYYMFAMGIDNTCMNLGETAVIIDTVFKDYQKRR